MSATSLTDAIAAYRRCLPPGEATPFAIDGIDRVGVPVRIVPFRTPEGKLFDGFGYGATPDEALVGALGEVSEVVHQDAWLARCERRVASYAQLVDECGGRHVADPLTLCLPAGSPYDPAMPLTWVPGSRLTTGERVWLPVEFAASYRFQLGGVVPLITPITNGLGAGTSREQALGHGLLELVQRDGNTVSFRALDRGTVLDIDGHLDAGAAMLLRHLRGCGLGVAVKLAATEFGIASVYVVGDDLRDPAFPMMLTACGEAAHPHLGTAIRKAMLEFAAARSRKAFMHGPLDAVNRVAPPGYLDGYLANLDLASEEPRCLDQMVEWLAKSAPELRAMLRGSVFAARETRPLSAVPTVTFDEVSTPALRYRLVLDRLSAAGCDAFALDFSPPGGDVFATKVVVSNVECETMSYYRLGERGVRRLVARGDDFAGLGNPPSGALPVRLTAEATARLGGPAWLHPGRVDALVGPLYPLYREPSSHAAPARLAQLSARSG